MQPITIYTPSVDPYDSYGIVTTEMARHLERIGVRVQIYCFVKDDRAADQNDDEVKAILERPFEYVTGGILLGYPTLFKSFGPLAQVGPRMAFTMFESTELPPGWVDELNTCHSVIAPSTWCRDVFENCGVTVPVSVNPLGVNPAFTYKARTDLDGPFKFLAIGDRGMRKGWEYVGAAFVKAFGDRPGVRLLIKMRNRNGINEISNPNIDLLTEDLTRKEMVALYQSCECMVFPTRGEGFGYPPREFAATGGLALATNWSGTADDIHKWGVPLDNYTLEEAWADHGNFKGLGVWSKPDVDELATLMRQAFDIPANERNKAGKQRAANIRSLYPWSANAECIRDEWERINNIEQSCKLLSVNPMLARM